jgi:hypothetical protein
MPDRYGFNHLGDEVRCIDCPSGGPLGRWPEPKRAAHAHTHQRHVELRPRNLLAAATQHAPSEEKEATTMVASSKGDSAKQVAIDILREAGTPMPAKEIAKQVLASGRCAGLKGKTPEATIGAMLAVGSKPGGPFKRVGKGTYALREAPASENAEAQTKSATEAKPTAAKPPAAAAKPNATRPSVTPKRPPTKRASAKRATTTKPSGKRSR